MFVAPYGAWWRSSQVSHIGPQGTEPESEEALWQLFSASEAGWVADSVTKYWASLRATILAKALPGIGYVPGIGTAVSHLGLHFTSINRLLTLNSTMAPIIGVATANQLTIDLMHNFVGKRRKLNSNDAPSPSAPEGLASPLRGSASL
jgi:hypothetical protein